MTCARKSPQSSLMNKAVCSNSHFSNKWRTFLYFLNFLVCVYVCVCVYVYLLFGSSFVLFLVTRKNMVNANNSWCHITMSNYILWMFFQDKVGFCRLAHFRAISFCCLWICTQGVKTRFSINQCLINVQSDWILWKKAKLDWKN